MSVANLSEQKINKNHFWSRKSFHENGEVDVKLGVCHQFLKILLSKSLSLVVSWSSNSSFICTMSQCKTPTELMGPIVQENVRRNLA